MSNDKKQHDKQDKTGETAHEEEVRDEALEETFPASDPPGSTSTTDDQDAAEEEEKKKQRHR